MNDTWSKLPEEKRARIINAALCSFGANGYKKTSMADIASAAGISKPMLFTYFGSKPGLYAFVADYAVGLVWEEFRAHAHKLLTDDFFERIRLSTEIKTAMMKRHPAILSFLTAMYYEEDAGVRPVIDKLLGEAVLLSGEQMLKGIDTSRFKPGVEVQSVVKLLTWASSRLADVWRCRDASSLDALLEEFNEVLAMLRTILYKEEQ